jgi:hypothetical protein
MAPTERSAPPAADAPRPPAIKARRAGERTRPLGSVLSGRPRWTGVISWESWSRRRTGPQALGLRARIVLAAAEGLKNTEIAARLAIDISTVRKWRNRFAATRLDGLNVHLSVDHEEPRNSDLLRAGVKDTEARHTRMYRSGGSSRFAR